MKWRGPLARSAEGGRDDQQAALPENAPGQVNSSDPRYDAGPAVAPPAQLERVSSQPYIRKVWHEPRYIAASDTQGAGCRSFRGKRAPGILASLAARRTQVSRWKLSW